MGQIIKGKGVVIGKGAATLRKALEKPNVDPEKVKKFEEAVRFHRKVKIIK